MRRPKLTEQFDARTRLQLRSRDHDGDPSRGTDILQGCRYLLGWCRDRDEVRFEATSQGGAEVAAQLVVVDDDQDDGRCHRHTGEITVQARFAESRGAVEAAEIAW